MAIATQGYECDSLLIHTHYQPAVMLDLAISRGVDSHALLRGTQLFLEDMLTGQKKMSPAQFLVMIQNCQKLLNANDTSFLFGQRMLPGYYGPASQLLRQAGNCRQALQHFCQYHALLSPLLTPRYFENETHCFIYWLDSCGATQQQPFLMEASMTAVAAMTQWLAGEKLPWRFNFDYAEPRYIEQYWVHLSQDVAFNQQVCLMSLPLKYATHTWPNSAPIGLKMAEMGSQIQLAELGWNGSFIANFYDYLRENIQQPLNLESVAETFGMSPASLKRKLLKHNTHFQAQLDMARKHVALYLYQIKGYNHQQVADYLCFNDINNYRRSFKRWTGFPPGLLLQQAVCY